MLAAHHSPDLTQLSSQCQGCAGWAGASINLRARAGSSQHQPLGLGTCYTGEPGERVRRNRGNGWHWGPNTANPSLVCLWPNQELNNFNGTLASLNRHQAQGWRAAHALMTRTVQ